MAKVKFKPGKFSRAFVTGGFGGFEGLKRTCVRYHKDRNGNLRCKKFKPARKVGKHPKCPKGFKLKAADPRGKSPGLIRKYVCAPRRKTRR